MANDSPDVDVIALVERLSSDPVLLRDASDAARQQGRASRNLPENEVRRHITAILDAVRAAASGDAALIAEANAGVDDLALDRLEQGIGLEVLLQGVRSARSVLLDRVIAVGRDELGAGTLITLLGPMDALVGAVHDRMILTYRTGERDKLRSMRTARVEALRELLGGGSTDWAAEAGLDPQRSYLCLVADVSIPGEARRLDQLWVTPDGISGIVHGYMCRVSSDLPTADLSSYLLVVSPRVRIEELAGVYSLCRQALSLHRSERATGTRPLLDAAQGVATSAQPLLGELLARDQLADLDPTNDFHRELAATAQAYISSERRAEQAAASLHIHANTLRYRIRRFNELTGASLAALSTTDSADRSLPVSMSTWWALESWLAAARTGHNRALTTGAGHEAGAWESCDFHSRKPSSERPRRQ